MVDRGRTLGQRHCSRSRLAQVARGGGDTSSIARVAFAIFRGRDTYVPHEGTPQGVRIGESALRGDLLRRVTRVFE